MPIRSGLPPPSRARTETPSGGYSPYTGARDDLVQAGRRTGRGGHRNAKDRRSDVLSIGQCENVWAASHFAFAIGRPLNRYVTINWSTAGVPDPLRGTGLYLKRAGDWLRDRGVPLLYVWTRESVGGLHTHLLMHVPTEHRLAFSRANRRWLVLAGAASAQGVRRTRPVGRSYDSYRSAPADYLANLQTVVAYLLKGASEAAAVYAGRFHSDQGVVVGKRSGASIGLGAGARRLAKFDPPAIGTTSPPVLSATPLWGLASAPGRPQAPTGARG